MSTTIDQRVVEMRFDNKQFESNVQTSMSTIEKLKQSLNFTGASKSLEGINDAAKKVNMSGLSSVVEAVQVKFSALEVMAVTALANITNSAFNAGKRIVSALTIDPIKMGFQEYETQINAIQTILANTSHAGTTLDDVTAALDELNKYADMTIYNFTEMTRNIGTFTAAGVDLDTSVGAIKGIANLAALSGSNAQQASTAMYQLSQAIAAGQVTLQDWNSVVNAGMGGKIFQDALMDTAEAMGIVVDRTDSFRNSISTAGGKASWLTSEVLLNTLNQFTGDLTDAELAAMGFTEAQIKNIQQMAVTANDAATKVKTFTQLWDTLKESAQSGWTQSWEIIIGDFEEAKELLTEISDTFGGFINASAEARNNVLQGWKDLGGRTAIIDAFRNTFNGLLSVIKPISEAFREIFPPITAKQLVAFSEALRDLTAKLTLSKETSDNLKSTFKGLFAILDIVRQAFVANVNAVAPLLGGLGNLGGGILSVTASFGDWIVSIDEAIKKSDAFNNILQPLSGFIMAVGTAIGNFIQTVKDKLSGLDLFQNILERINERMSQVGDTAGDMGSGVIGAIEAMGEALVDSKFMKALQALWDGVKTIFGGIIKIIGDVASSFAGAIGDINFNNVFDVINTAALGGVAYGISKFLKALSDPLDGLNGILENVTGILDNVRGCFEAYQTQLQAGTLLKIATAIGILAASILVISMIDSGKLSASLGAMTVLFANLMGAMALFSKISGPITGVFKTTTVMLTLSVSILILASALKKIANLDFEDLAKGLLGVAGLAAVMVAATKILSSGSKTIIRGSTQMVIFAAAITILASACTDLAQLDWNGLAKGLVGVGVLLAEVSLFLNTAKFSGKSITTATGIVILSAALKILASACYDFAQMKWEEIGKGLTSIGALLTELILFTKLTGNAKNVISTGVAMIALGAAMKVFASAVQDFSGISWEELARGLTGMAGALAAVTLAIRLMPKNMIGIGAGLVVVSSSLLILAEVLDRFGGMSWEGIAKGMTALGGSMGILALGLNLMKGTLAGSAAMLVAAAALAVLTPVLSVLGGMSWESIAKGLVAVAGAFAVIGAAGALLTPLVPTILGLSGAFALIGVGVVAIGAGLLAAGAGLSALAVGIAALATALAGGSAAIVAGLTAIIMGVAGLIPAIARELGEALIVLCEVIVEGAPAIGEAVKALILTVIDVLVECVPALAAGALELIAGVLAALADYTPQIVDSIFKFLISLLDGIAQNLPELIKVAVDVIVAFFAGIVDALSGIDTTTLLKTIAGIGLVSGIMLALSAAAALVPSAMAGVLGLGAVIAELAIVLAAIGALAQIPGLSWLINEGAGLLEDIGNAIGSLIGGIIGGIMGGVTGQFPKIATDLSNFMTNIQPFINGAKAIDPSVLDGVKALAETILILTAANILDGLTSWITGGSSLTKFAQELVPFGTAMRDFSFAIAGMDSNLVANAATAGKTLAEMAATIPNSGGVVSFFTGENDMGAFAAQLVPFGLAMKQYSMAVRGMDSNAVVNSATAGKALSEMATTIPNTGGLVSFFTGENDMIKFGEQIVPFGAAMKAYSYSVSGLDVNAITNSTVAGQALVELANTIPNIGGLVSFFTGTNDMATFGAQLVSFGRDFKMYSDYVKDVNANVVTSTSNAAQSLVTLANSLPENKLFSSDTTLSDFGSQLRLFGQYMEKYYEHISNINVYTLNSVINETNRLVAMAKGMDGVNTGAMSSFGKALTDLGKAGIEGFINAFKNSTYRVQEAATGMITTFINGVNSKTGELTNTFMRLVETVLTSIKNKYQEFYTVGQTLMTKFTDGMASKEAAARNLMANVISSIASSIKNGYRNFYQAGEYLVEGFIDGMEAHMDDVRRAARKLAREAYEEAMDELDEHSPSRKFAKIGAYVAIGFANGISDNERVAKKSSESMARTTISTVRDTISRISEMISGDLDDQPTIRPVLDLSDVEPKSSRLNALFSRSQAMSISADMNPTSGDRIQNGVNASKNGATFQFTQNNYSPKALSRVDIYRQTNNQFSAFERMVRA